MMDLIVRATDERDQLTPTNRPSATMNGTTGPDPTEAPPSDESRMANMTNGKRVTDVDDLHLSSPPPFKQAKLQDSSVKQVCCANEPPANGGSGDDLDNIDDPSPHRRRSTRKRDETSYVETSDVVFDEEASDGGCGGENVDNVHGKSNGDINGHVMDVGGDKVNSTPITATDEDDEFDENTAPVASMPEPKILSEEEERSRWTLIRQLQAKLRLQEMSLCLLKQVQQAQNHRRRPVASSTPSQPGVDAKLNQKQTSTSDGAARVVVQSRTIPPTSADDSRANGQRLACDVVKRIGSTTISPATNITRLPTPVSNAPAAISGRPGPPQMSQADLVQLLASAALPNYSGQTTSSLSPSPSLVEAAVVKRSKSPQVIASSSKIVPGHPQLPSISWADKAKQLAAAKKSLRCQLEQSVAKLQPLTPPAPELQFVPNPGNSEFMCLVGLEECVSHMLATDTKADRSCVPFTCGQCGTDFTPTWKWDKSAGPGSKSVSHVVCENCVNTNVKRMVKTEQNYRLASTIVRSLQMERDLETGSGGDGVNGQTANLTTTPASLISPADVTVASVKRPAPSSVDLALGNLSPALTIMPVNNSGNSNGLNVDEANHNHRPSLSAHPVGGRKSTSSANAPAKSRAAATNSGPGRRATPSPRNVTTPDTMLATNHLLSSIGSLPLSWQQSLAQMVKSSTSPTALNEMMMMGKGQATLPTPHLLSTPSPGSSGPTPAKRGRGRNSPSVTNHGGRGGGAYGLAPLVTNGHGQSQAKSNAALNAELLQQNQQQMLLASLLASAASPNGQQLVNGSDVGTMAAGRKQQQQHANSLATASITPTMSVNKASAASSQVPSISQLMAMAHKIAGNMDSSNGKSVNPPMSGSGSGGHYQNSATSRGKKSQSSVSKSSATTLPAYPPNRSSPAAASDLSSQLAMAMQQQQQHHQSGQRTLSAASLAQQQQALMMSLLGANMSAPAPHVPAPASAVLDSGLLSLANLFATPQAGLTSPATAAGGSTLKASASKSASSASNLAALAELCGQGSSGMALQPQTPTANHSSTSRASASGVSPMLEQIQKQQALLDLMTGMGGSGAPAFDGMTAKQLASVFASPSSAAAAAAAMASLNHSGAVGSMRNGDLMSNSKLKSTTNHRHP